MANRIVETFHNVSDQVTLFLIGAVIGVGQLMRGDERITLRVALGRALTTGGLSLAAGSGLLLIPDAPVLALQGLGALLASLGTSSLERLLQRVVKGV